MKVIHLRPTKEQEALIEWIRGNTGERTKTRAILEALRRYREREIVQAYEKLQEKQND